MLLKENGGAGTVHPVTGLPAFSESEKKDGTYIWRTRGDGKVRSEHAERDGKEFSWDDPPDGGHPGEAPNCRCRAEDVEEDNKKCDKLKNDVENARLHILPLKVEVREKGKSLLKAETAYMEKEERLFSLVLSAGLSELFDSDGGFLEKLLKLPKRGMAILGLQDILDAHQEKEKAEKEMDEARIVLKTAREELAQAETQYLELLRKHDEECAR